MKRLRVPEGKKNQETRNILLGCDEEKMYNTHYYHMQYSAQKVQRYTGI